MTRIRTSVTIPGLVGLGLLLLVVGTTAIVAGSGSGDAPHADHRGYHYNVAFGDGHGDPDRGWTGVQIEEAIEVDEGAALVSHVIEDSPAAEAGLQDDDVIVGVNGRTVRGPGALRRQLAESKQGDRVTLEVLRDGSRRTIELELGEFPGLSHRFEWSGDVDMDELHGHLEQMREQLGEMKFDVVVPDVPLPGLQHLHGLGFSHRPKLGVQLIESTPELREHLGGDPDGGVLISKVLEGMPAQAAGLRVGDLIQAVDGETIESARDLIDALEDADGETIEIDVIRDGRPVSIDVRLPEAEDLRSNGPRA